MIFKDKKHDSTHELSIYKYNKVNGKLNIDPFASCKNLKDVRDIFLTDQKNVLLDIFKESEEYDFVLAKINKRNLGVYQQFFPQDFTASLRFIKDEL